MQKYFHYYVEGEDEKKLIDTLKFEMGCIESGKVDVFNVIQNEFTLARIRLLKTNTTVILVYDTDKEETDTLRWNIAFLKKQSAIKEVICIPQVNNLEDELVRSCHIKTILELTNSRSEKGYKNDLIRCTNLKARLEKCGFHLASFWNLIPKNRFHDFGNQADKIKKVMEELSH